LDIFVVIPVYREKESPPEFYQTLAEPLRLPESTELIFAGDRSKLCRSALAVPVPAAAAPLIV
jgi:hypothetical protein